MRHQDSVNGQKPATAPEISHVQCVSKDVERSDGRLDILVSDVGPDRGFLDIHGGETTKEENAIVLQTAFAESSQSTVKARIKHSGDSDSYKARSIRLWS